MTPPWSQEMNQIDKNKFLRSMKHLTEKGFGHCQIFWRQLYPPNLITASQPNSQKLPRRLQIPREGIASENGTDELRGLRWYLEQLPPFVRRFWDDDNIAYFEMMFWPKPINSNGASPACRRTKNRVLSPRTTPIDARFSFPTSIPRNFHVGTRDCICPQRIV